MGNTFTYIVTAIGSLFLLIAAILAFVDSFYKGSGQDSLFAAGIMILFAIGIYLGGIFLSLKANFAEQVGAVAGTAGKVVLANPELLLA